MKITINQMEAAEYMASLREALKLRGEKLSYAVTKNLKKIESAGREEYFKHLAPEERSTEYRTKMKVLQVKYGDKDPDTGELIIDKDSGRVQGLDGNEEFQDKAKELMEEFKDVIDGRMAAENSTFEVDIHMVSREALPSDISGEERLAILFMIEGEHSPE